VKLIVDTNVPLVANRQTPQASPTCVEACVRLLLNVQREQTLVLDHDWYVIREYKNKLRSTGEPGVGDAFLKWVLTNRNNPARCERISITRLSDSDDGNDFAEFPVDPALTTFDRADRKFVAIALAHPEKPPIFNATDTDWWIHQVSLEKYGIEINFLCPDAIP